MLRIFLVIILCINISFAKESLYFLPKESKQSIEHLTTLIENSKSTIDVAVYNFTYKKLAKLLKKKAKDGVKITVILDKKKVKEEKNTQYKYLVDNGIDVILTKNKLHIKMAIFDKKRVLFGSANWKKSSFTKDYEIIYINDHKKVVKKLNKVFNELK